MNIAIFAAGGFILLLSALIVLRTKMGNKLEIKNTDVIIALVPILLMLFFTGKIQELTIGDIKIAIAFREASESPVEAELTALPVEDVRVGVREALPEIPEYIEKKVQALSFQMSSPTRLGKRLIVNYLETLTAYPFLRFIIITNLDGSFFGIADAQQTAAISRAPEPPFDYNAIAGWLLDAQKDQLRTLPGFIGSQHAIKQTTDKLTAIQKMDTLDVEILPVTDDAGNFKGLVERSKLTASMLIDILNRLKKE